MWRLTLLMGALGVQACASSPPPRQSAPAAATQPEARVAARRQVVVTPECSGPARSVPQPARDSVQVQIARVRGSRPQPIRDDYWHAELAREMPGRFAGLYLGSPTPPYIGSIQGERRLVVLLADTTDVTRALAALQARFGPRVIIDGLRFADAVVRKARWDFAQLLEWQHFLVPVVREVMGGRRFAGGVSAVRNRVVFEVPDATAMRIVEARLAALDLPCDLLRLEVGGQLVPRGR
jgi:hypothetical protein